jgi:hypothetical protein
MAAQVITQEWVQPMDAEHRVFRATSDVKDSEGNVIVTAYAVLRPDEQWSVMLINKDFDNERQVRLVFHNRVAGRDLSPEGKVTMVTFGRNQYEWHREGDGYADPDRPPLKSFVNGGNGVAYALPPASITVLRGRLDGNQ